MLFFNPGDYPLRRLRDLVPGYFLARTLLLLLLGLSIIGLMGLHLFSLPDANNTRLLYGAYGVVSMLANGYLILWYPLREAEDIPGQHTHPLLLLLVALSLALALATVHASAGHGADTQLMAFSLLLPACSAAGLRWAQATVLLSLSGIATLVLLAPLSGLSFAALLVVSQFVTLLLFKSMIEEFQNRLQLDLNLAELQATQALLKQSVAQSTRHAIARDLHDELGHLVTRLHLCLQALQTSTAPGLPWQQANELLEALRLQIRAIALQLRQSSTFELRETLNLLGQSVTRPVIQWDLAQLPEHCPAPQGEVIFRLCQEAITNCLRHSNASHLHIQVRQQSGALLIRVGDNGDHAGPVVPGSGLAGLQERLATLGGTLTFPTHERGFTLEARLPVTSHDQIPAAD